MKLIKLFLLSGIVLLLSQSAFAVAPYRHAAPVETGINVAPPAEKEMTRKEKREMRKAVRHQIRDAVKNAKAQGASDDLVLLIILAILLPPLAMFIYEDGATGRFWISLLLTLLFYLPGLIYTLVVILGEK